MERGGGEINEGVPKASRKGWVLGEQTRYKLKVRLGFHRNDVIVLFSKTASKSNHVLLLH